jgi:hypothetical protein
MDATITVAMAQAVQRPFKFLRTSGPAGRACPITAATALLLALMFLNLIRVLRHAMWRDELEIFQISVNSSSAWDLLTKLTYEGHPGPWLWNFLLWIVTRFTAAPLSMQMLHVAIAIGTWTIIYRWSPFTTTEKILLLVSYFLFWEYFVISRNYALIAFIGLSIVALREHHPEQVFLQWILLGLLANTYAHGIIWSIALASTLILRRPGTTQGFITGGAAYLALLILAIVTAIPAMNFYPPWGTDIRFDLARFPSLVAIPIGGLIPINPRWVLEVLWFAMHPTTAPFPHFWNPSPIQQVLAATHGNEHPIVLSLTLLAPVAICWLLCGAWLPTLEFTIAYIGLLLFANILNFPGVSRHHGIVFLALIASVWSSRGASSFFRALLVISALGGILTLTSELMTFSQGRNAAEWIKNNNFAHAFLIGSRDAQVSTVAGYLGTPIYYLNCECTGTAVAWTTQRVHAPLPVSEMVHRLVRALDSPERNEAILILSTPIGEELGSAVGPILSLTLLATFVGAVTNENYWIYRVKKDPA